MWNSKKTVKFYWKKGLKGCYRFIKCSLRKLGKKYYQENVL